VLETAYELGIRHFDVAPIYGFGLAEPELGTFRRTHPDITISTKFGMQATRFGRIAGLAQSPVRRVLRGSTTLQSRVKQSGRNQSAGAVGRMLYARSDYSAANARRALARSRDSLGTERIDHFLLHEPIQSPQQDYTELVDFLETERQCGALGSWGPGGDLCRMNSALHRLTAQASTLQIPYDLIAGDRGPAAHADQNRITFGFLGDALPRLAAELDGDAALRERCSALLDADLANRAILVKLLVRDAVRHNAGGTVLLSSTHPKHLQFACGAASVALPNEDEVARVLRERCLAP
jgi:D-threo-aldose 1-dehydrogenase